MMVYGNDNRIYFDTEGEAYAFLKGKFGETYLFSQIVDISTLVDSMLKREMNTLSQDGESARYYLINSDVKYMTRLFSAYHEMMLYRDFQAERDN